MFKFFNNIKIFFIFFIYIIYKNFILYKLIKHLKYKLVFYLKVINIYLILF